MGKILNGQDVINGLKNSIASSVETAAKNELISVYNTYGLDFIQSHFTNYGNSYDSLGRCLWYDNDNTNGELNMDWFWGNYLDGNITYDTVFLHSNIGGAGEANPFYDAPNSTTGN